ncbi:MAG: CBS domain-containing protein [Polyangiales bacterium]
MQKLSDIMTRDVQTVPPTCSLQEVATQMREHDVGAIPVCDGTKLLGVITDRDIAVRSTANGQDPKSTKVSDVMSPEVSWCFEDADVAEAVRTMEARQLRRIPIVSRDKKLVGIVALADLARSHASDQTKADGLEGVSQPR